MTELPTSRPSVSTGATITASIALYALLSPVAMADRKPRTTFVGALAWGYTELTFDEKLDADTVFNSLTVTGALSRGNVYSSLSFATSVTTENISEEDELGSANRRDVDWNIGYRATPTWAFFAGYRTGSTDIDFTVRDTTIRQQEFYRENGPFIGASYSIRTKQAGNLSFTVAYSRNDTDLKFTAGADEDDEDDEGSDILEFDDLEGRYSDSADGWSTSVNWIVPLSKSLAMRTQYKVTLYDLDVRVDGTRYDPTQRLVYFNLGLLYAF